MVELEESLLTQVMMAPDLDAVLIGSLEGLTADGTDALCLSMLPRESVMLGWPAIEVAASCLQQANVHWQLAEAVAGRADAVRYKRLSVGQNPSEIMASLLQIQQNLSVKTLQISLVSSRKNAPAAAVPTQSGNTTVGPISLNSSINNSPKNSTPAEQELPVAEDKLDQLLDELDSLNL